jgi:hypothetical protein
MMDVDRRTTIALVAGGVGAFGAAPTYATDLAANVPLRVVFYDGRYPGCAAFARQLDVPDVLAIDTRQRDIGAAWRAEVAAHLAQQVGRIEGLSLYADGFIAAALGRERGLRQVRMVRIEPNRDRRSPLFRWTLA